MHINKYHFQYGQCQIRHYNIKFFDLQCHTKDWYGKSKDNLISPILMQIVYIPSTRLHPYTPPNAYNFFMHLKIPSNKANLNWSFFWLRIS